MFNEVMDPHSRIVLVIKASDSCALQGENMGDCVLGVYFHISAIYTG